MKTVPKSLIWTLTSAAILTPVVIIPPILIWSQRSQDPNQRLFDQSGYQDSQTGFMISAYGNLLQKLGFQPTMNFANVTNKQLAKQLQIYHLDQFFTINVISGAKSKNEIQLHVKNLKTATTTPVIIKNLTWNPLELPDNNAIEIIGRFEWQTDLWLKQQMPISFTSNQYPNPESLLKLSDQQIKALLISFNFESLKPMFNFNNSPDYFLYQYRRDDTNNRDLFHFQFIQNLDQSISLNIQLKDPTRFAINHHYDPDSDQWINDPQALQALVMNASTSMWQGTGANGLAISAIDDPIQSENRILTTLFHNQIKVKQPDMVLEFSASELIYQLDHQLDFANSNSQLKTLLDFNKTILKPFLAPGQTVKYLWTLKKDYFGFNYEVNHYLNVYDNHDLDRLETYNVIPRIQIGDRFFQFEASNDQWDQIPRLNSNNFFTKTIISKFSNQLILKDDAPLSQIFINRLKNNPQLIQLIKQWITNPQDPMIEQTIIEQIKPLLKFSQPELTNFYIQSQADWYNVQQSFNFNQFFPFTVVNNTNYWQQSGQYNLQQQTYTTTINQKLHNFHFENWYWSLKTNQDLLEINQWKFDPEQKTITLMIASTFSWQPEELNLKQSPMTVLIINGSTLFPTKGV